MSKYYQSCKSRELNKRKIIDRSDKSEDPPEKIFNIPPIFGPLFLCSFGTILATSDGQVKAAKYRPPSVALMYNFSNGPLTYADFGPILAANSRRTKESGWKYSIYSARYQWSSERDPPRSV